LHRCEAPSVAGSGRVFEAGFFILRSDVPLHRNIGFRSRHFKLVARSLSKSASGAIIDKDSSIRCAGFNSAAGSTAGRQCWLLGSSRNCEHVRLGRDWLIATWAIVQHPSGGSVNSKAPSR